MIHSCPNFRSGTFARGWAAEQIHRYDKEISAGLLKAKLSREPAAADDAFRGDVPLAALVAGLQKNRDVLPLLDGWGATDLGFISETCRQVAEQLRGREKC